MKKIIYILVALVIFVVAGYFLFLRDSRNGDDVTILPGQEREWSVNFPEIVPEYTDGEIREITIVDEEVSRYDDEIAAIVDDTNSESLTEYVEQLVSDGWIILYESPETESFYNVQLSLDAQKLSISLDDSGVLRLSTYVVQE
jgi:hypothetical protein